MVECPLKGFFLVSIQLDILTISSCYLIQCCNPNTKYHSQHPNLQSHDLAFTFTTFLGKSIPSRHINKDLHTYIDIKYIKKTLITIYYVFCFFNKIDKPNPKNLHKQT